MLHSLQNLSIHGLGIKKSKGTGNDLIVSYLKFFQISSCFRNKLLNHQHKHLEFPCSGSYLLSSPFGCLTLFEPWASHAILIKNSNITILHQSCASLPLNFVLLLSRMSLLPLFLKLIDTSFKPCYSALNLGCVYFLCYFKMYLIFLNHYIVSYCNPFVLLSASTSKPVTLI